MTADPRPLVVLAGHIHPEAEAHLSASARVAVVAELTEARVVEAARDAQGILVRGGPRCGERLLRACPRLRVIGRHGVGLDTVDLGAATRLGVAVVHAPGSNSQAVAEHALMLMLACAKRARTIDRRTRAGDWSARHVVENVELGGGPSASWGSGTSAAAWPGSRPRSGCGCWPTTRT